MIEILEAMDSDTDDSNNSFCPITTQQQQVDSNKSGANNNGTDKNRVGDNINIDSSSNIVDWFKRVDNKGTIR
mgnify:CR=1 FL=1